MKLGLFKRDIIIYANIIIILMMLLARTALKINISPMLILLVAIIPAFYATESQMVAMVLSFLALGAGFQYKYAILVYLIVGLFRFNHRLRFNPVLIFIALMMLWELLHSITGQMYITEYFRQFAELLFLGFVASLKWKDVNYKLIARSLALAVVGVSIVIIIVHMSNGLGSIIELFDQSTTDAARFGQGTTKDGTRFGLNFNANNYGFICNMAISSLFILISRKENKFIDVILLGLCFFFGLTTLSRTFVVVFLFQVVIFMFATSGTTKQKILTFFKLLFLVLILLILVNEFAPFVFENFMARNDTDDITNGRGFLFQFYNTHIFSSFKYLFWGLGLQGYGSKIAELYGANILVCHNGIQELCVTWGILGVVLFAYLLASMIQVSRKSSGVRRLLAFVPLAVLLLDSMAGQLVSSGPAMMSMSMIYVTLCLKWNSQK